PPVPSASLSPCRTCSLSFDYLSFVLLSHPAVYELVCALCSLLVPCCCSSSLCSARSLDQDSVLCLLRSCKECTCCMRDLRLNGHYMPLDSQPRDGVSQVSVQGLSVGCSSDSCKKNHCKPPFTCVDLWRVHECRYTLIHTYVAVMEHIHTYIFITISQSPKDYILFKI
ncbi:hypothetical protein AMECASPLE_029477, partial [Ameca splendens]